jgi:hypothetical protein
MQSREDILLRAAYDVLVRMERRTLMGRCARCNAAYDNGDWDAMCIARRHCD